MRAKVSLISHPSREMAEEGPPPLSFSGYMIAIMCVLVVAAIVDGVTPTRISRIFPAPIVMFILVMSVALIALSVSPNTGFFSKISQDTLDSDALQALYLPPLLFSDVMKLNIRVFKKSFWQVNWLVFPGVIGGAALTALFPLYLMPSGPPFFSAYEAFAFGSALSTTDPIAVLMILNDVGAPKRLAALVGGESLLNDGSSIVMVTLFLSLQGGQSYTAGQIVAFCFQEVLVGPCIGIVAGLITLILMKRVQENVVALVALSFAVPYLTFAVCLFYVNTSGVLAVIALGIVLNRFGHAFLSRDNKAVESFWEQVEFFAVMTLYAQVGIFVAADFLQGAITGTDWGSLILLYLFLLLVRLIVIVVSFPILKRTGYGLSWKEAVVVWHAGLRGAIGILLSFSIKNAAGVSPRTGALVLFFTAGVVVLMLINVVTTKPLCRLLGIRFDSSNKVFIKMKNRIDETTLNTLLCTGLDEATARKGIAFPRDADSIRAAYHTLPEEGSLVPERRPFSNIDLNLLSSKRQHMCASFRATFSALQEAELIPRHAWFLLVTACERKMDASSVDSLLQWEDIMKTGTIFNYSARFGLTLSRLLFLRKPSERARLKEALLNRFSALGPGNPAHAGKNQDDLQFINNSPSEKPEIRDLFGLVETAAYCAFGLLVAHQRGRRIINEIFADLDNVDENEVKVHSAVKHANEVKILLEESLHDCQRPAAFLDFLFRDFPDVIEIIKRAHTLAQVQEKNIQVLAGLKRAGFAQGVALKQLFMEVERLNECVSKLEFPVLEPKSVGPAGNRLLGNPNFGPFVPQRQWRKPLIIRHSSTYDKTLQKPKKSDTSRAQMEPDDKQDPQEHISDSHTGSLTNKNQSGEEMAPIFASRSEEFKSNGTIEQEGLQTNSSQIESHNIKSQEEGAGRESELTGATTSYSKNITGQSTIPEESQLETLDNPEISPTVQLQSRDFADHSAAGTTTYSEEMKLTAEPAEGDQVVEDIARDSLHGEDTAKGRQGEIEESREAYSEEASEMVGTLDQSRGEAVAAALNQKLDKVEEVLAEIDISEDPDLQTTL